MISIGVVLKLSSPSKNNMIDWRLGFCSGVNQSPLMAKSAERDIYYLQVWIN